MGILDKFTARRLSRQKRDKTPVSLKKHKKFTFFTYQGFFYLIALAIIGVFSVNYNNNLSIAMLCFLATFYLAVLFRNYAILRKMVMLDIYIKPARAQERIDIVFEFSCSQKKELPMVWLRINEEEMPIVFNHQGIGLATWSVVPPKEGVFYLPPLYFYSLWPQGLNKTWCLVKPKATLAVCPARSASLASVGHSGKIHDDILVSSSMGDPDGIRPLLPQERSKISWKHTLKRNKAMTYTYTASSQQVMIIPWPNDNTSAEEKIVFVSQKVDEALNQKMLFQLRHPDFTSSVGAGEHFAVSSLCSLVNKVFPPVEWEKTK